MVLLREPPEHPPVCTAHWELVVLSEEQCHLSEGIKLTKAPDGHCKSQSLPWTYWQSKMVRILINVRERQKYLHRINRVTLN